MVCWRDNSGSSSSAAIFRNKVLLRLIRFWTIESGIIFIKGKLVLVMTIKSHKAASWSSALTSWDFIFVIKRRFSMGIVSRYIVSEVTSSVKNWNYLVKDQNNNIKRMQIVSCLWSLYTLILAAQEYIFFDLRWTTLYCRIPSNVYRYMNILLW